MEDKPDFIATGLIHNDKLAIRTHDRIFFKRCRRRWYFQSPLKRNLGSERIGSLAANLWFGTGIHFALEDYHGYNIFGHPLNAFDAYVDCFEPALLDGKCLDLVDISEAILNHYEYNWLPRRKSYDTLWINGKPMVEVELEIPIPELTAYAGREVVYQMKLDRVIVDSDGQYWIQDYKTAAKFDIAKLETDPQINAYLGLGEKALGIKIEGMNYLQFLKAAPEYPKMTGTGQVSFDKKQKTTYAMYYQALHERYGPNSNLWPEGCKGFLNELSATESPDGDPFIRQDYVTKSQFQKDVEYRKMLAEGYEMLNPKTILYPNPTRDCYWECPFRDVCIAMDDGNDWTWMLTEYFTQRELEGGDTFWKNKLKYPVKEIPS